jgi:O-antigen/teichoic acid export membrane protein
MRAVYGRAFLDAAVPFAWLMLAAIALLAVSVATVLLVAADRPWLVLATSAPMLATLGAAGVVLIPRHGGAGAAQSTLLAATMGAVVSMAVAVRTLGLRLPARSMLVGGGLAVLAFGAARAWPADGIVATVVEVAVLAAAIALVLVGTREFRPAEVGVVFGRRAFRAAT